MAINYPLSIPVGHHTAQKSKLTAWTRVALSESPFTGSQQVYQWPGEGWKLDFSLRPMKAADAEPWIAFLLALRGMSGTFECGDTARKTPQGVATGTPLTNGAGGGANLAGATQLVTDGWTPNVTGILKAGDYIQVQAASSPKRLHKVLADANSDGSGNATFDIFPRLRETLADNLVIVTASAKGTFRLAGNQQDWSIDQALVYGVSFSATEAL